MRAKDTKVRAYDSYSCAMCGGNNQYIEHYRLQGQCYVCIKCSYHENIKAVLTREYRQELSHVPKMQRQKFLDMMQRDVVRWFKEKRKAGFKVDRLTQEKMDLQ